MVNAFNSTPSNFPIKLHSSPEAPGIHKEMLLFSFRHKAKRNKIYVSFLPLLDNWLSFLSRALFISCVKCRPTSPFILPLNINNRYRRMFPLTLLFDKINHIETKAKISRSLFHHSNKMLVTFLRLPRPPAPLHVSLPPSLISLPINPIKDSSPKENQEKCLKNFWFTAKIFFFLRCSSVGNLMSFLMYDRWLFRLVSCENINAHQHS